jgi:hypothetical protein
MFKDGIVTVIIGFCLLVGAIAIYSIFTEGYTVVGQVEPIVELNEMGMPIPKIGSGGAIRFRVEEVQDCTLSEEEWCPEVEDLFILDLSGDARVNALRLGEVYTIGCDRFGCSLESGLGTVDEGREAPPDSEDAQG